ncbi:FGGY-family carbohydrate kinase [Robbsia andropogonis]|uniref:FGGY-family carbohydrate kinase n=1 Tax=Robbsia andropogonis TaxID=28092 RepID=UPI00209F0DDE|nr:FGGY-family carbohydrate kinase [Robbsia andropogonis]MCP1118249.1 FGGY-family carbohydrate kinase [Robbsia andropogonis]MCP1127470.1 FGGY-family carbohydrate kinase [Robbsia andropogonis]
MVPTHPTTAVTESTRYVIGVDVGTGSARAAIFDLEGRMIALSKHDITLHQASGSVVEQSSSEIWNAVCWTVKDALSSARVAPEAIVGISFDATCSLVVIGPEGQSMPVGTSGDINRDIIVWMDHRAVDQAERINATGHDVLKFVGGKISPEMETPKLLWLLENKPSVFAAAWQFFDLTDYLTWRASGSLARSTCTVTCKWTYLAHEKKWDESYFRSIGLGILADEDFMRIGQQVVAPGTALGNGLTENAAEALGLPVGTFVAAGAIDAHAGGIGTVGADGDPESCLAYVFGTSSCTMTTTVQPVFVPGVWGPYFSAMVPDTWLNEGGQSVAGAAIEQLLLMHPANIEARHQAEKDGVTVMSMLARLAVESAGGLSETVSLAKDLHIVPEFLGNRAPMADPHARAVIAGLGMDRDLDSLIALYIAGICSIGYGLRQIMDVQASAGAPVDRIIISGGAGRLDLVRQLLADATGKPVLATQADEPVLLGAAMLGAVAAGQFGDLRSAMRQMAKVKRHYEPSTGDIAEQHLRRFDAFTRLQGVASEIRQ